MPRPVLPAWVVSKRFLFRLPSEQKPVTRDTLGRAPEALQRKSVHRIVDKMPIRIE
jgi:hypothetical protein